VIATPALIGAAAGVAFGHAVLPDHWVPLAVLGRARRYPISRVARLSVLAAITHVLVSLVLGAVIVVVGLQFRSAIQHAQDTIVGLLLIGTGAAFAILELTGRGHHHHHDHNHDHHHHHHAHPHHDHDHDHAPPSRLRSLGAVIVPFGAAASPDLTILPVFLAASTAGVGAAVGSLTVFAGVTILTIVGLTVFATAGGYQIRSGWLDRWGNALTAGVLLVIGALVLTGVL
jgi:ABC-type nickel/cobalt efflux system permease component RcnA